MRFSIDALNNHTPKQQNARRPLLLAAILATYSLADSHDVALSPFRALVSRARDDDTGFIAGRFPMFPSRWWSERSTIEQLGRWKTCIRNKIHLARHEMMETALLELEARRSAYQSRLRLSIAEAWTPIIGHHLSMTFAAIAVTYLHSSPHATV
jgi:hypothetical protein